MSMKKVEQFFKLIEGNEVLAKRLAKINEELKNESEEFLNCEQAINEKIIPFAEENGVSFTAKDFLDYTNSKLPSKLTREDLLNVSGGVSPKTFAITLGALLTLPFASGSLMSFADDGIGNSVPQQTQTQAAAQNAADNEAEQKTFKYEPLWFSSHRSDKAVKDNLVNFIIGNNIKSPDQIDNLPAFIDDASRIAPKIEISRNETYEDEKLYFFDKELQDRDQGSVLELISRVADKINVWDRTPEEELEYLYKMSKNVRSLMEIPEVNQDDLVKGIKYVLENVKETSKNSKEIQHLQELLEEHARYTLEKERVEITLGHQQDPLLNYVPKSIKDPDGKISLEEKLDDLYEVVKFIQSIKDLPKGFNLGDLIWDIENLLDEIKETKVNSYKVQHLRNLYNEYEKNYSAKNFTPSPEGASLGEQINNVYEFISSSLGVTKETEGALKDETRAILSGAIDPNTGEIREDLYINLVGKENFERILEDLEKISDRKTWREEMKKLNEEENNFISKVEKIRKHYDSNYAIRYNPSNNFEKLSTIEKLRNLSPVISKCERIFDVNKDTMETFIKNIKIFIGETWNANTKTLEMSGTLNTETLQELNALQRFAEKSGIHFVVRLNKVPNNSQIAEIFDSLLKTSRRINTTNDLSDKDAKEYKGWAEFLARQYYNPRLGAFEVPGAEGINGKQIIDVCNTSGIKLKIGDDNPAIQKDNITERFNNLAWILERANTVDDLTDVEATKKELQDLVNEFYNARKNEGRKESFEIPITKSSGNKIVLVGTVSPPNGQTIINECKRLRIKLKIDLKKFSSGLCDDQKFFYLEGIAKRINSTDDLTETGKKVFESEGTKLIKELEKNKNNSQYREIYNKSYLKKVYESSISWPIIYFSPGKEMSQMSKINYFEKVLKMHLTDGRKFEAPNDSEENFEGEKRTYGQEEFISDVLKLGGTHYNAKTGEFKITDGSYDKVTDEGNSRINMVKKFYKILIAGDQNSRMEALKFRKYKNIGWTLSGRAQSLLDQLEEQDWNWAAFSPETLQDLISDLRDVVSRIERGRNELYYLNDAWFGTNENRSIESKDLEKLKEVLDDYNSWL